jgi:hypothetical protein
MPDMTDTLSDLTDRLERAAAELRGGELSSEQAAALVEDCARLATEAAAELDRRVRAAGTEPLPELARQLSLSREP